MTGRGYTRDRQLRKTWYNQIRAALNYADWTSIKYHDCGQTRLARQDPVADTLPASAGTCGNCGSASIYPADQKSAAFCPDCGHDLFHQDGATRAFSKTSPRPIGRYKCGYCGTTSTWWMDAPAAILMDNPPEIDFDDEDVAVQGGDAEGDQ